MVKTGDEGDSMDDGKTDIPEIILPLVCSVFPLKLASNCVCDSASLECSMLVVRQCATIYFPQSDIHTHLVRNLVRISN